MPIITPAYPSMCATFNITRSSMTIIKAELQRGLEITEKIMVNKLPWSDLFVKHNFFTQDYKYYISVTASAKTKEAQTIWSGYIESKVRMLVQKLEQHPSIQLARPFNKGYSRKHHCKTDEEIEKVQEGSLAFVVADDAANGDSGQPNADGEAAGDSKAKTDGQAPTDVYTTTHYIGLELEQGARSLDLSFQVDEFKSLCTQWQKYQDELKPLVSLGIHHVKK